MTNQEQRLYDRKKFLSTLMKIEHGNLDAYTKDGDLAAHAEPELFAHFIAWNAIKGKVRDSKVAYPVIGLRGAARDRELAENAVAHLMLLSPRDLVRAYDFHMKLSKNGMRPAAPFKRLVRDSIHIYLRAREAKKAWWDRTVLQHRDSMKRLYRISNHKPDAYAQRVLFENKYASGSIFAKVAGLKDMTPKEAAATILVNRIPFEVVTGALSNIKDTNILLALLEGMTGNQVVTNTKMLEKLGVMKDPMLRAAYDSALQRAKTDKKLNVLKAGQAIEAGDLGDETVQASLLNLQASATKTQLGGVEGNWLVLGDCSGSMIESVELAKKIASLITEQVKGKVWLIYFSTVPIPFEVSGKTYFQINDLTKRIMAGGGTSIGCGLEYLLARNEEVDGIVIVSDGGENTHPTFPNVYQKYSKHFDKEPTVYHFDVAGESNVLRTTARNAGITIEEFDMRHGKVDYYSLPNIIAALRTNRYSLVDEIMSVPLLTMESVYGASTI